MKSIILLIVSLLNLGLIYSQDVLSIDLSSSTIRYMRIIDDTTSNNPDEGLVERYLKRGKNKKWSLNKESYVSPLKRKLSIGDYIVFEVNNPDEKSLVDSISISYQFLDKNIDEYGSTFENIINSNLVGLNQVGKDNQSPGRNGEEEDDKMIDYIDTLRNIIEKNDLDNPQINNGFDVEMSESEKEGVDFRIKSAVQNLGGYKNIFSKTIEAISILTRQKPGEIYDTLNLKLDLIEDINQYYSVYELRTSKSDEELFLNAFIGKMQEQANDNIMDRAWRVLRDMVSVEYSDDDIRNFILSYIENELNEKRSESGNLVSSSFLASTRFAPLQIVNKDLTYIYLEAYTKGKPLFDRTFTFRNKSGFKVDFSAGLVATNLIDDQFSTRLVSDTLVTESDTSIMNRNAIVSINDDKFNVGFSVLAHFYVRTGGRLNLSLSSGFSLNSDARINYLLGGSILLGLQQRFVINYGVSTGQVKRLNPTYSKSELIPVEVSVVPTIDKWKIGYYFGVSYNL